MRFSRRRDQDDHDRYFPRRSTANQPVFQIQRIYLKDASLEMPNAPGIFLESENPKVDVQLEVSDSSVIEALHEVVVRVTVTAKVKDKVLFLVEASRPASSRSATCRPSKSRR